MKVNEIIKEMDTATSSNPPREFKVTRTTPQGVEVTDVKDPNVKMTVGQDALTQDKADPTKLTLDPNFLAKADANAQQAGIPVGTAVNVSTTVPGQITPTSAKPSETMGSVSETMQEISPKLARYYLRKIDAGEEVTDLVNDSAELHTMYNDAALMHHLHPDDDFEKIEQIVINNLNDIADSDYEDDFYDADESEFEPADNFEFESIKRLAGL